MSKVIKAARIISLDDKVVIQPAKMHSELDESEFTLQQLGEQQEQDPVITEAQSIKDRILSDAEASAESILAQATADAKKMKDAAQAEIQKWWEEKRKADVDEAKRAKEEGHRKGQQEGLAQAEAKMQEQYASLIDTAKSIIEQGSFIKQQMILEAEPFLIELSTAIAEKVISRQLTLEPQWILDAIRKQLERKREQGIISLCVSPSQFAFIQSAKEELHLAIDSQAELQVLPDPSIHEYGCVIRSSFGSIDARIDTQLEEIKEALLQVFRRNEGVSDE